MKKKTIIIISIIAVIITAIIIVIISKKKKITKEIEDKGKGNDISVGSVVNYVSPYLQTNATFPLIYGSKGKQVAHLQKWLNSGAVNPPYAVNYPQLVVDGILGDKTKSALLKIGYSLPVSQEFYNTKIENKYKL